MDGVSGAQSLGQSGLSHFQCPNFVLFSLVQGTVPSGELGTEGVIQTVWQAMRTTYRRGKLKIFSFPRLCSLNLLGNLNLFPCNAAVEPRTSLSDSQTEAHPENTVAKTQHYIVP